MSVMTTREIKEKNVFSLTSTSQFPLTATWLMWNVAAVFWIEISRELFPPSTQNPRECSSEDGSMEMLQHVKFFDIFIPHWLQASSTVCSRLYFYVSLEICFNFQRLHVKNEDDEFVLPFKLLFLCENLFEALNIFVGKFLERKMAFKGKFQSCRNILKIRLMLIMQAFPSHNSSLFRQPHGNLPFKLFMKFSPVQAYFFLFFSKEQRAFKRDIGAWYCVIIGAYWIFMAIIISFTR